MSTLKVNKIENTATTNGGVQIDVDGHVTIDGQNFPTAGPLSNRNLIINGAMQVAQRGTSTTVSNGSNEGYSTVDRWFLNFNDSIGGATTFSQSTDAPAGFSNSAKIQCSTTASGFASNQYLALQHRFEGQNLQSLAYGTADAKSVTVSWYMKTDVYTDPISVTLFTIFGTAEYYTVSVTPTTSWAKYSVTVPGSSTATINNDNLRALDLQFVLAGNTSSAIAAASDSTAYSTTRGDFRTDVGNFLSSTSNAIYITGVQLEVGSKSTPFEHRSYGDELARCQRYFYTHLGTDSTADGIGTGSIWQSNQIYIAVHHPVTMRSTPVFSNNISASTPGFIRVFSAGVASWNQTGSTFGTQRCGTNCSIVYLSDFYNNANGTGGSVVTYTAGDAGWLEVYNDDLRMDFSAEL